MSKRKFPESKKFKKKYDYELYKIDKNRSTYTVSDGKQIRNIKKVPPSEVIKIMTTMTDGTLDDGLWNAEASYSVPAFIKQRDRLSTEAFTDLIQWTYYNRTKDITWKGLHTFACDGSDIRVNPKNIPEEKVIISQNGHPYGLLHLSAIYDVGNNMYLDSITSIRGDKGGEVGQLITMIRRNKFPEKSIIICDRGYCSLVLLHECIVHNIGFCIRTKKKKWISLVADLPDEEIDFVKEIRVTTSQTRANRELQRNGELIICHGKKFGFSGEFTIQVRVTKFQLPGGEWETLLTTLTDTERFTSSDLKDLYHKRWGCETAFRTLKYRIGLNHQHAKKLDAIILETYAKVLSYNLCMAVINMADISYHKSKYKLMVNVSKGIIRVLRFFRAKNWHGPPIEDEIARYVCPVVPDKPTRKRNLRDADYVFDMQYRAA